MSQRRQETRRARQEQKQQQRREARRAVTKAAPPAASAAAAPAKAPPGRAGTPASFWTPRNRWIVVGAVAALAVLAISFFVYRSVSAPLPGTKYASQGNDHLTEAGQPHEPYNSNPPSSGPHLPPVPKPGIYTQVLIPEGLGHFMEHGGVWVLYNCPDNSCPNDVDELKKIVNSAVDRGRPAALAPFPTMESRFAVVAWQYVLNLDRLEKGQIENFINRHACRYNPEGGPFCTGVRGKVATTSPRDTSNMVPVTVLPFSVFGSPSPAPAGATPAASPRP